MKGHTSVSFPITTAVASLSFFPGGNLNSGGAAVWTASGTITELSVPIDRAIATSEVKLHIYDARKADGSPMDSGGQRHLVTVGTLAALNGDFEAYGRAVTGTLDGANRVFTHTMVNNSALVVAGGHVIVPVNVFCPMGMLLVLETSVNYATAGLFLGVGYKPISLGGTRRQWAAKNYQYCI